MRRTLHAFSAAAILAAVAVARLGAGPDPSQAAKIISTSVTSTPTPAPTPTPPVAPSAGYAAWFDAGDGTFTDAGGTVPAVADGDAIANWSSKGGSYGALACTVPGGYGAPHLKTALNGIGGLPVARSVAASFELLRDVAGSATIFEGGVLNVGQGTAFAVARAVTIDATNRFVWGDHAGYVGSILIDAGGVAGHAAFVYDGATEFARQAASAGSPHVLTFHHEAGLFYSGVDDTRTASMATVAAGDLQAAAGFFVLMGGPGPGNYLDGDLAELIFYPTALTQAERKVTERYLAAKYGITLPY